MLKNVENKITLLKSGPTATTDEKNYNNIIIS